MDILDGDVDDVSGPYSRLYWSIMDDAKFDGIREDVRVFGAWSLLLIVADMAYPSPAFIPATVPKACVARLATAELIDVMPGSRFRVHGLASERERRSEAGRNAAASRWQSDRTADPMLDKGRGRDEAKDEAKAETRQVQPDASGYDGRDDLEAFVVINRRAPSPKQRRILDEVADRHDQTGPAWAADIMFRHPDDPIGAVIEADKAWREERIAAAQAAEPPMPKPRRPRGFPTATKEILEAWVASEKNGRDA